MNEMCDRDRQDELADALDAEEILPEDRQPPVARPLRETVEVVRRIDEYRERLQEPDSEEQPGPDDTR
jgi:hypothetical protein